MVTKKLEDIVNKPKGINPNLYMLVSTKMHSGTENVQHYELVQAPNNSFFIVHLETGKPLTDYTKCNTSLRNFIELVPKYLRSDMYFDEALLGINRVDVFEERMNMPIKATRFAPGTMFVYNGEQYLLVREFHHEYGLIQISTGTPVGSKVCSGAPDVTAQQVFDMCTADMRSKIEVYDKYVR